MTMKTTFGYVGLDEFAAELEQASLDVPGSLGRPLLPPIEDQIRPHLWRWSDIERLLDKLGTLQLAGAGHEGLERRMLRLANPGTPRSKTVTQTMSASVQKILPGEVELSHRHTASAVRFFLKGHGTYTTVEGDKCVMEPGDLIVTPNNFWHDYGNEGTEPGIWFDALDFPLVQYLDACGWVERIADTVGYETALEPPLPPLRPSVRTRAHRHASSAVYLAVRGRGATIIGGRRFDWGQGDLFVVPSWLWHEHANPGPEPAILFSVQDFPAMRALHLYREEAFPGGQQTVTG